MSDTILELPNVKNIFIPSAGKYLINGDYKSGDLFFVTYESDCQFIKQILNAGQDVYSILASHYYGEEVSKKDARRQIFKAICHGCLTGDHEVLTKEGWVALEDLEDAQSIAVWDINTRDIHFEVPKGINRDYVEASEDLFEIKGAAFHQICTQDHTFPYTTDKPDNLKSSQAILLPKSARLPYNGNYKGGFIKESKSFMQLIAALQADGSINHIAKDGTVTYRFKFVKERKIIRLRGILEELGISYKEWNQVDNSASSGNIRTCFSFKNILPSYMKKLDWWILDYSKECINIWLDELQYWDGHTRTSNGVRTSISTTDELASEIIQTISHLCGKGSKVICKETDETRKTLYEVSMNNRLFHNMATGTTRKVSHSGTMVYCPKTTTGFFMVRYNGNIMVTGNTNYLGEAPTLAATANLSIRVVKEVQNWYFSQCPEIKEWHERILNDLLTKGYTENVFGARHWEFNPDKRSNPMFLNKAVAFVPQSSVAILVNKALVDLYEAEVLSDKEYKLEPLLQVHDAILAEADLEDTDAENRLRNYMEIPIHYLTKGGKPDTMTVPVDFKSSRISYGDCH